MALVKISKLVSFFYRRLTSYKDGAPENYRNFFKVLNTENKKGYATSTYLVRERNLLKEECNYGQGRCGSFESLI